MVLDLTPEQQHLRDSVRAFLAGPPRGTSPWHGLTELGVTEIPFPERFGGAGFTLKDVSVVTHELGRSLSGLPYLSSVCLAGAVLAHSGSDAGRAEHLPAIAAGSRTAALVAGHPFGDTSIEATSHPSGGVALCGTADFVVGGDCVDLLVVVARTGSEHVLAVVDADAPGVSRNTLESLDLTRPLTRVTFSDAVAHDVGGARVAEGLLRAQASAVVAVASEQVGAAEACLEMSVDHARTREQFGRRIGSFQAIKHRLADMLVTIELARAAVLDAASADSRPLDDFHAAASTARVLASRAFTFAAEESIQIHGGIGFTWEHPLHRYFRRAKSTEVLFGTAAEHREIVASALL